MSDKYYDETSSEDLRENEEEYERYKTQNELEENEESNSESDSENKSDLEDDEREDIPNNTQFGPSNICLFCKELLDMNNIISRNPNDYDSNNFHSSCLDELETFKVCTNKY